MDCTSGKVVSMGLRVEWFVLVLMSFKYCDYTKCSKTECSPRVCLGEWLTAPLALLCLCQCYSRAIVEKLFNVT